MNKDINKFFNIKKFITDYLEAIIFASTGVFLSMLGAFYASFIASIQALPIVYLVSLFLIGVVSGGLLTFAILAFKKMYYAKQPFYQALEFIKKARPKTCHCFSSIAAHDSALFSTALDVEEDLAALSKLGLIEGSNRIKQGYKVYCVTPLGKLVFEDEKETILEQSKVWDEIIDTYKCMDDPSFD